jgi:hypothetical protein
MSFPRLGLLALPVALCAPLLTGACGGPVAVAAASYGADGASVLGSGKTTSDHFISIVSKKDCAMWRIFRNQDVCREREGDPNPYKVNYDEPFRQVGESGVEYGPAPHSPADAPAASWDSAAYKPEPQAPSPEPTAAIAQSDVPAAQTEPPAAATAPVATAPPQKAKPVRAASAKKKKRKPAKKPAPDQVASSR